MSNEPSDKSRGDIPSNSQPVDHVPVSSKSRNETASLSIYKPLKVETKEIRLLALHPSPDENETLNCTLSHAALLPDADSPSPIPEYEALSYVWGAPDFSAQILLNNEEFWITSGLETILSHLRRQDRSRLIWVDALCINQSDLGERAQQVALMRNIYSVCQQDIAWLEPDTAPSSPPENMDSLSQAEEDEATQRMGPHERMRMGMEVMRRITQNEDDLKPDADGRMPETGSRHAIFANRTEEKALGCLFENCRFWDRVWIVQELSCAPDVTLMCKGGELRWTSISTILKDEPILDSFHRNDTHSTRFVDKLFRLFHQRFGNVKLVQEQRGILNQAPSPERGETESTLMDVLARFRGKESTDPRDRIYGLLGLVTQDHGIRVDYTRSVSGLYQETTRALINMMGNLDIICQNPFEKRVGQSALSQATPQASETIPSWGAEFDTNRSQSVSVLFAQRNIFNAGSTNCKTPCQLFGPNQEILVLKGTVLSRIGPILQAHLDKQDDWDVAQLYLGAESLSFSSSLQYVPSIGGREVPNRKPEDAFYAYFRTVTRDCTAPPRMRRLHEKEIWTLCVNARLSLRRKHTLRTCYPTSDRDLNRRTRELTVKDGDGCRRLEGLILLDQAEMLHPDEWMFCVAENGLYLLVRHHAREGDVVVVLDGGKVPMVLRRVDGADKPQGVEDLYHIVGPAYVHGLMDGEVEVAAAEGWLKKQDFFIA